MGQRLYNPVSGRAEQLPDPPAHPSNPEVINEIPMSMTVGPVTSGGKTFFKILGEVKDMRTSRRAQTHAVPIMAPYPSGQGSLLPSASEGQNPVVYICASAPLATGIVANDVPTTEISPVPM